MSAQEQRPSLIQSLLGGGKRRQQDQQQNEAADKELDIALARLSRALDENAVATAAVRRRQSSGSLKIVSLPEPATVE